MTTEPKPKYPNPDTSPERLRAIEKLLRDATEEEQSPEIWILKTERLRQHDPMNPIVVCYDLLAMLYEQRQRKLSEKLPNVGCIYDE